MKIKARRKAASAEGDLTPMIDMTFQLIAFFMILINFNDQEQHERVVLPKSEIVKPPEEPPDKPMVMHLMKDGKVNFRGQEVEVPEMEGVLRRYKGIFQGVESTIIIRAHEEAETGKVQELISVCQGQGFEKFALRAKQDERKKEDSG